MDWQRRDEDRNHGKNPIGEFAGDIRPRILARKLERQREFRVSPGVYGICRRDFGVRRPPVNAHGSGPFFGRRDVQGGQVSCRV